MGLDVPARLFEVELRQRRIVRTGACDEDVIDRRGQVSEKFTKPFEVESVEGRHAQRTDFARGALERLGVSSSEDNVRTLGVHAPGGFESDAGAAADHDDGLPEELWSHAHDFSDHQFKIAFA
jgi:hypothetical protein